MAPRKQPPDDHLALRRELLDDAGIVLALRRIASEIAERVGGVGAFAASSGSASTSFGRVRTQAPLALVGIRTGGYFLAQRLQRILLEREQIAVELGSVDITLYRDDVFQGLPRPELGPTEIPFDVSECRIVLVDDVLYTGRTVRAAIDVLLDYGRPPVVELAVLVDRGHRELPIQADYVGLKVATARSESVRVLLAEHGEKDRVVLREQTIDAGRV